MKIAIVSDTHSNTPLVLRALAEMAERRVDMILHCGDLEDADTVRLFPPHTHFVLGNCDTDTLGIRAAIEGITATFHDAYGVLEVEGSRLGFLHGHDRERMRELENADAFDFLFHGHTHVIRDELKGNTRIVNPGALYRAAVKTFAILDLPSRKLETIVVA